MTAEKIVYPDMDPDEIGSDEQVHHALGIDPDKWRQWDVARQEMLPFLGILPNHGWMFGTLPWTLHMIFFAPLMWCGPMTCVCVSKCLGKFPDSPPMPEFSESALILTTNGIRGYERTRTGPCTGCNVNGGPCLCCGYTESWEPAALTWHQFDKNQIQVLKTVPAFTCCIQPHECDPDLACGTGFGLMCPCVFMTCCSKEIPGYYTMRIHSKDGQWHGRDNPHFVPNTTITARALLEEEDKVMTMLEEGLSGHYGQPATMVTAPPPGVHAAGGSDTPPPPPPPPLPQDWTQTVDPASGEPYYYNTATQVTQWDKPVG